MVSKLDDNISTKYYKIINKKLKDLDIRFNNKQHQFKNTECGVYSINFI
jgi:hypothetical protein